MKTLTGKTISLDIKYWIVYDVMVAVQDLEGIPPGMIEPLSLVNLDIEIFCIDQQRLIYNHRQLEELGSLYDYGLHRGNATIHLVLRLRGGGAETPLEVDTAWSGNMLVRYPPY